VIENIESAIVSELEEKITDIKVVAFPSAASDFKKLPFQNGLVLVAYAGSALSEPTNRDSLVQSRFMEFTITLQVRNLRGHQGAYDYLETIRATLSGFSPNSDLNVMFMSDERLLQYVDNNWVWVQTWQLEARQV
jgi:hypothetical protein